MARPNLEQQRVIVWDPGENPKASSATIAEFVKTGLDAEQAYIGNKGGDAPAAIAEPAPARPILPSRSPLMVHVRLWGELHRESEATDRLVQIRHVPNLPITHEQAVGNGTEDRRFGWTILRYQRRSPLRPPVGGSSEPCRRLRSARSRAGHVPTCGSTAPPGTSAQLPPPTADRGSS